MTKKKEAIKIEAEQNSEITIPKENLSIQEKKMYSTENLIKAMEDLSLYVNNAYFRTPYNRCPNCNKGFNNILAHFGTKGKNTIGNLKGFNATIGDVIAWSSPTYKGLSIVKAKNNGVFELETSPFEKPRKEPAVIERLVVPSLYRTILGEMAEYLENEYKDEDTVLVAIGKRDYPDVIRKKLQKS